MRHLAVVLALSILWLGACSSEQGGPDSIAEVEQAVQGACFSNDDCPTEHTCDTSQCLSCCAPGSETCITACCGKCVKQSRKLCRMFECAPGFIPIDPDGDGCDNACRLVR